MKHYRIMIGLICVIFVLSFIAGCTDTASTEQSLEERTSSAESIQKDVLDALSTQVGIDSSETQVSNAESSITPEISNTNNMSSNTPEEASTEEKADRSDWRVITGEDCAAGLPDADIADTLPKDIAWSDLSAEQAVGINSPRIGLLRRLFAEYYGEEVLFAVKIKIGGLFRSEDDSGEIDLRNAEAIAERITFLQSLAEECHEVLPYAEGERQSAYWYALISYEDAVALADYGGYECILLSGEESAQQDSAEWDFQKGWSVFAGQEKFVSADDSMGNFHYPLLVNAEAAEKIGAQVLFHVCFEACYADSTIVQPADRAQWEAYLQELGIPIEFLFEYEYPADLFPQNGISSFYHAYLSYADMKKLSEIAQEDGYWIFFRACTYDEPGGDAETVMIDLE